MELSRLLKIKSIKGYNPAKQIDIVGKLFDGSFDNGSIAGIEHAFGLAEQINYEALPPTLKVHYHYLLSNGSSYTIKLKHSGKKESWNFQLPELTKEIYHLRKAISFDEFAKIKKERQCQIYTNLGNTLSEIGRFVEAQEYWSRAISILPTFAMAIANKGNGLIFYRGYLYDETHQNIFFFFAFHWIGEGLKYKRNLEGGAENYFRAIYDSMVPYMPKKFLKKLPNLNHYSLGKVKRLRKYREWCLENCLFINPLNDLGDYKVAAHDCLNLGGMVYERDAPPVHITLFNQMKQELGAARFMYYDSIQRNNPHFSDDGVVIVETRELAQYSYFIEELKSSFRLTYSILDKIAFFLNDYLKLGIKEHEVSFKSIWFEQGKNKVLRSFFQNSENWALRGLFWLSA